MAWNVANIVVDGIYITLEPAVPEKSLSASVHLGGRAVVTITGEGGQTRRFSEGLVRTTDQLSPAVKAAVTVLLNYLTSEITTQVGG